MRSPMVDWSILPRSLVACETVSFINGKGGKGEFGLELVGE